MKISDLCESERPREKLVSAGPGSLSNAELLGVLLRTGTRGDNAVDLGHRLLGSAGGNLLKLSSMRIPEICAVSGIKKAKAAILLAAFELGRRFMAESSPFVLKPLTDSSQAYRMILPHLKGVTHEECWIIMLNSSQLVVGVKKMTSGGGGSTVIDNRDILREMILAGAKALILVHNHPSGNPAPSRSDNQNTASLRDALHTVDMTLLDHLIICDNSFYSYADESVKITAPF